MDAELQKKEAVLKQVLYGKGRLVVAFSGGVDSAYLVYTAHAVLGDAMMAVTVQAPWFPSWEAKEAEAFCSRYGIRQITRALRMEQIEGFRQNPPDRCYHCKKAMFSGLRRIAEAEGFATLADGTNADDASDYRPGMRALGELQIASPLQEAGLTKAEIRQLSRIAGLPTWDKPAYACLASRFVYGEEITPEKLQMVESGEQLLRQLGFRQLRVRLHGNDAARIEVLPEDLPQLVDPRLRESIVREFRAYGFSYISADLQGYRTGSMNEVLPG